MYMKTQDLWKRQSVKRCLLKSGDLKKENWALRTWARSTETSFQIFTVRFKLLFFYGLARSGRS